MRDDDDDIDVGTLEALVIVIGSLALIGMGITLLVRWAFP